MVPVALEELERMQLAEMNKTPPSSSRTSSSEGSTTTKLWYTGDHLVEVQPPVAKPPIPAVHADDLVAPSLFVPNGDLPSFFAKASLLMADVVALVTCLFSVIHVSRLIFRRCACAVHVFTSVFVSRPRVGGPTRI